MFTLIERSPLAGRYETAALSRLPLAPVPRPPVEHVLRFGRCEVRPASREVLVNGQCCELQPRPFDLLVYLIRHRDRVLSIDELLDAVWGDRVVQISSLAAAISRIRIALGDGKDGCGEIIRTHHRVGYRFVAPLKEEAAS